MAHIPSTNHELALFSLVPINDPAKGVLSYFGNRRLLSLLRDPENPARVLQALNVGFNVDSKTKTRGTLATIGRAGDVIIPDDRISRIQCSFEINVQSQEVMLYDRSTLHTTFVRGPDAHDFSPGLPRKVLVAPGLNTTIWLGEEYGFALHWHKHVLDIGAELDLFQEDLLQRRTIEATSPARDPASGHALPDLKPKIRFQRRKALGSGSFGKVYKAANIDTGDLFAVKLVYMPDRARKPRNYSQVMREVETLARLSHPNIVDYLFAQRNDNYLEICMGLYQGSVEALVARDLFEEDVDLTLNLLHQMLMALDYLTVNGIVHRDIKPANILFTVQPSSCDHTFVLSDFGLCNFVAEAVTYAGTPLFMAPELSRDPQNGQTPKMDIWSLAITIAYAANLAGFRKKQPKNEKDVIEAVQRATNEPSFRGLRPMIILAPTQRASAAYMLDVLFEGKGRAVPQDAEASASRARSKAKPPSQPPRFPTLGAPKRRPASRAPPKEDTKRPVSSGDDGTATRRPRLGY